MNYHSKFLFINVLTFVLFFAHFNSFIMALRFFNKITCNTIQNLGKVLCPYRVENYNHSTFNKINNETRTKEINIQTGQVFPPSSHMPQIQTSNKRDEKFQSKLNVSQNHKPESHLKSSTKSTEVQDASPETQEVRPPLSLLKYQQFEKSTTYKNIKLPLKSTRLAAPFPDPVKVMVSDTMSDQEKADQKTAEARQKNDVGNRVNMTNFSTQRRYYSKTIMPDPKKCKRESSKKCPSLTVACKAATKHCDRDYPFKKCSKKKAPYPAYSEFCHTIPDEKPSECKMCPWKPPEHPTFKPPKKHYHTSSTTFSTNTWFSSKYEVNTNFKHDKENLKKCEEKNFLMQAKDINATSKPETISGNVPNILLKDNKPCKKPKPSPCPPGSQGAGKSKKKSKKSKKSKDGKTKKKSGKTKKPTKKKAVSNTSTDSEFLIASDKSWISFTDDDYIDQIKKEPFLFSKKGKKKRSRTGKCKKIPAGNCKYKRKPAVGVRDCPKTRPKTHKKINDCGDKCKKTCFMENTGPEFLCAKKKKHCPIPNKDKCKKKGTEDSDDPCGLKKKGTTRKCPGDLLVKRRRKPKPPKKRTDGVATTLPLTIANESGLQQQHLN